MFCLSRPHIHQTVDREEHDNIFNADKDENTDLIWIVIVNL